MAAPTAADLLAFQASDDTDVAAAVLAAVTALARSYTRSNGFTNGEPNGDIAQVIVLASLRLLANVGQLAGTESLGQMTHRIDGGFTGWSLAEKTVLDRYRVRAL